MLRVGLIGMGFMGQTHYDAYSQLSDVKVTAVCDKNTARCKQLLHSAGIHLCPDYLEIINDPAIDIVDICLATSLHRDCAIAALKAGKHVLLEKPLALNSIQGKEIVEVAENASGLFMVAHCVRFMPEYQYVHQIARSGKYGKIKSACFNRFSSTPAWSHDNWLLNPGLSGSALLDLHIHDVDFMLSLLGLPGKVYACGTRDVNGGICKVSTLYTYNDDVHVTIGGGWVSSKNVPFCCEFTVEFEKALLIYNSNNRPLTLFDGNEPVKPALSHGDAYRNEIRYFVDCVKTRLLPSLSLPTDSLQSLSLVEREFQSIQAGLPCDIAS